MASLYDLSKRLVNPLAAPAIPAQPLMTGAMAPLPVPEAPAAVLTPNARDLTHNAVLADQQNLTALRANGSGVSRLMNPAEGGIGHKILGAAAGVGDALLGTVAPTLASNIGGTTANYLKREGLAQKRLESDLGNDQQQAQTELTNAQPALKQAALDNASLRIENQGQHNADQAQHYKDQAENTLRGHGYKHDPQGNIVPLDYEELSPQAQGVIDAKKAQADYEKARGEYEKAKNDPHSFVGQQAQARMEHAKRLEGIAYQKIGLQAQGLGMRREMMNANLYGVGADGQALPGAPQIMGDDGQTQTVGLRAASNAIKQQKATGTFNDLVGSVKTTKDALEGLHKTGSSFADAQMIAAMTDPHSMVGKYVNGQLVKGNLNDAQIQALGAVSQLREQIGILRASTGGTAAEAQAGRMLETLPAAGDSPAIVRNKLKQIDGVLERLSPSVTGVKGGLSVGARGGNAGAQHVRRYNPATGDFE